MASTLFTYSPTTGSGNTNVSVEPTGTNTGRTSTVSTITFSGGGGTKSVTLTQYYQPYFTMQSTVFQASGGTLNFTVNAKYDYFFHNKPSWLTITRNGQTVQEDTRIPAGEGVVYSLTAEENTGSTRVVSGTFYMGHYVGNTPASGVQYFYIFQLAYAETTVQIPLTVTLNTRESDNFSVILNLESFRGQECGTTLNFTSGTPAWIGSLGAKVKSSGETTLAMEVTVGTVGTDPQSYTNNIALDYGSDSLYETGSLGSTVTFNTTYQSGEGMTIEIDIVS